MAVHLQAEAAAATESEPDYRSLVEHANDGIAVVQDERFVFGNPSVVAMSGRRRSRQKVIAVKLAQGSSSRRCARPGRFSSRVEK